MGTGRSLTEPDYYYGGLGHTYPCPPHMHRQLSPGAPIPPPSVEPIVPLLPKKRSHKRKVVDGVEELAARSSKKTKIQEEKRLRRFRPQAPLAYAEVKSRALTQRMFVIDRQRHLPKDPLDETSNPAETISLAGTTGNIYSITIDKVPSCTCPHAVKGNQCKHIVFCLSRVLRVREDLEYQLAFLSSELREIFDAAPPLPSVTAAESKDNNRKPLEDCGICCEDFDEEEGKSEVVIYCKAACGNNVHKACFETWAATKRGGVVPCPYCRTPWQTEAGDIKKVAQSGKVNEEGYINVASQLGLSGERDYSTYHPHWVRRQLGDGGVYDA